jgi:hypothetical protein
MHRSAEAPDIGRNADLAVSREEDHRRIHATNCQRCTRMLLPRPWALCCCEGWSFPSQPVSRPLQPLLLPPLLVMLLLLLLLLLLPLLLLPPPLLVARCWPWLRLQRACTQRVCGHLRLCFCCRLLPCLDALEVQQLIAIASPCCPVVGRRRVRPPAWCRSCRGCAARRRSRSLLSTASQLHTRRSSPAVAEASAAVSRVREHDCLLRCFNAVVVQRLLLPALPCCPVVGECGLLLGGEVAEVVRRLAAKSDLCIPPLSACGLCCYHRCCCCCCCLWCYRRHC